MKFIIPESKFNLIIESKFDKERLISKLKSMDVSDEDVKSELKSMILWYKSLPEIIKLYRIVHADSKNDINLIQPGSHYSPNRKDLISSHEYTSGYGEHKFIITVEVNKKLIDKNETLENRILYPNENEITLKNQGKGAKVLSVKKLPKPNISESKKISKREHVLDLINKFGIHKTSSILGPDYLIKLLSENFIIEDPEMALEFIFLLKEEKKLITKYKEFRLFFDEMGGVINWIYETPFKTESAYAYATPFWGNTWDIPIELDEFKLYDWTWNNNISAEVSMPLDLKFNGLNDLISWFNTFYVTSVYSELNKMIKKLRNKYNERFEN